MNAHANSFLKKIVNPDLALAALNCLEPYGEFTALVKVAKAKSRPRGLEDAVAYGYGQNMLKAHIPCNDIERLAADSNVVSIELREHVSVSSHG